MRALSSQGQWIALGIAILAVYIDSLVSWVEGKMIRR